MDGDESCDDDDDDDDSDASNVDCDDGGDNDVDDDASSFSDVPVLITRAVRLKGQKESLTWNPELFIVPLLLIFWLVGCWSGSSFLADESISLERLFFVSNYFWVYEK